MSLNSPPPAQIGYIFRCLILNNSTKVIMKNVSSRSLHYNQLTGAIPTKLNNIIKGGSFKGLHQLYVSLPHCHRVTLRLRCYFNCISKLLDYLMFHSIAYTFTVRKKLGCFESCKGEAVGLKKYQSLCSSVCLLLWTVV